MSDKVRGWCWIGPRDYAPDGVRPGVSDQCPRDPDSGHPPPSSLALALMAAYGGLRWDELANLRRRHVDARRGTVQVAAQVTELAGTLRVGPTKSQAGRRTVTLPASVLPALREHLERWAEPVLMASSSRARGRFMRRGNFRRRVWLPAPIPKS